MSTERAALLLLLALQAGAQDSASLGRLFTTPAERAQLDAQRNQAPAPAGGARSDALPPGGVPGGPGTAAATPCAPGSVLPCPAAATVAPCVPGMAPPCPAAAMAAPCIPGTVPPCTAPAVGDASGVGATASATPEQGSQEAQGLRLDGIVRRSHGPTVLIVNGEVQPAPAGGAQRGAARLQADGHSVLLKPGQRYDPATGEIHEAAR